MQMVKNTIIGFVLAWFMLLVFMPKQELYYKAEQRLEQNDIVLNEKEISSGLFSLELKGVDVYVKGIKLAKIDKIDIFTLLFYSKVHIDGIHIDKSLQSMTPTEIEQGTLVHATWKPLYVDIGAEGAFGGMSGGVDMSQRVVRLDFNDSTTLNTFKKSLQEDEKGWYYETSF